MEIPDEAQDIVRQTQLIISTLLPALGYEPKRQSQVQLNPRIAGIACLHRGKRRDFGSALQLCVRHDFACSKLQFASIVISAQKCACLQVLTPQKQNSLVSTGSLNPILQQLMNPPSADKPEAPQQFQKKLGPGETPTVWRHGDRVIHTKNDYNFEVFNGDLGEIVGALLPYTWHCLSDERLLPTNNILELLCSSA